MGRQSRPLTGEAMPQGRPMGAAFRAREFRRSASLFWGPRRVRTTIWNDSPPGCAARQRSRTARQMYGETTMPKFAHIICLNLHRHARACRGHPRLGTKVRRGWPGQVYGLETYLTAFGEIPDTSAERQGGRDGLAGGVCGGSASGVRDAGFACGSERIGVERAVRNQPADGPCMAAAVRGGGE